MGMINVVRITKPAMIQSNPNKMVIIMLINRIVSERDFSLRYEERVGIKAALSAPSPNRRRNRLGMVKANIKASQTGPKKPVHKISLRNPKIRLKKIQALIIPAEPSTLFFIKALHNIVAATFRLRLSWNAG